MAGQERGNGATGQQVKSEETRKRGNWDGQERWNRFWHRRRNIRPPEAGHCGELRPEGALLAPCQRPDGIPEQVGNDGGGIIRPPEAVTVISRLVQKVLIIKNISDY